MNWLPTFLSGPAAALAAAIAIPSLLLLYFLKLRRREQSVSSTILWRRAVQDLQVNAPFQKLRRNLLLLLQMLILIALLLALANPITFYRPGAGENTVILIDHSASMNTTDIDGHSRLEEAKKRAIDLVDSMGRNARAMVIAFADSAETVQPYTSDAAGLKTAINSIRPTDRSTKLKLAYQLADAQSAAAGAAGEASQKVFLYSDGQAADAGDVSLHSALQFEPIGSASAKNIAIVALSAKRNYDRPTSVQIFARLANYSSEIVNTDVELSVSAIEPAMGMKNDFKVRQVKSGLKLFPSRWSDQERDAARKQGIESGESIEFTVDLTTAGVIRLQQMNGDDALAADNIAQVIVPPPKPLSVVLVTEGNYFLEKALASLNLHDPVTLAPADWEKQRLSDRDVIIFDRYVPQFTPASGNFVWFDALPDGLDLKQSKDSAGRSEVVTNVDVLDWKRDHAMLRELPLTKLYVAEAMKLNVPLADEVLIEGTAGPLVVLDRRGRSTHLVVGFDVLQSNWPLRISFPLFVKNALQFLAAGGDLSVREAFSPGATPRLPRAAVDRALAGKNILTLAAPLGQQSVAIAASGDVALPPLESVGLYATDPPVPAFERVAVNLLDERESNTQVLDHAPSATGGGQVVVATKSPLQWWWWLLACVGVPVLLLEWWIYSRRIHA